MSFTGNEDHSISLEEAVKLTRNYREHAGKDAVKAEYFGKDAVNKIIAQNDCVGMRIYYGETEKGKIELILVGVNSEGKDFAYGNLAEKSLPCPPYCDPDSPLSS